MSTGVGVEALQGEGVFFGGVAKTELLKTVWVPVTLSNPALVRLGDHAAALINLAGEYAVIETCIPYSGFGTLSAAYLVYVGAANQAGMRSTVQTDYGRATQAYNVHSAAINPATDTTINEIGAINIIAALADLAANDVLGVTVLYNATAPVTNMYFLGLELVWT